MAVRPISAPVVIRRNFTTPTTTIRETQLDLGIRPAQAELAEILKVILSKERNTEFTGAIASAQDNVSRRVHWGLSTQTGLTSFDNSFEDGIFWSYGELVQYVASAAAVSTIDHSEWGQLANGTWIPNPPVIIAANTISLYDIAIETDAVFTSGGFGLELMYRLVQVDQATLAALLARGDLFL